MVSKGPFSQEELNEIFKISTTNPDRIISRESGSLEFKESFGWASLPKYLKTCVSFANAKGGYIVFGIANNPHRLTGLSGANLKQFEDIDPEKMSGHFNDYFSPEIIWDMQEYELQGRTFGLLYVVESKDKPVVCTKDAGKELRAGDIYYRYRGRSERIKYPELRSILEFKRENEQKMWMQHLSTIAQIGVRDAGIFSLHTGLVSGTGGAFLIDETLLSQLSFIKEGEFSEVEGKPVLKLIGDVEPLGKGAPIALKKQILKTKGIRTADIVLGFLKLTKVSEPEEYIRQICFENTGFLPVYYYMKKAGLDVVSALKMVEDVVSRSQAKNKLIERLKTGTTQHVPKPKGATESSRKKLVFIESLLNREVTEDVADGDLENCLQAIRMLSDKEIKARSKYIRTLLNTWFNRHYATTHGVIADNLRRAVCWLDEALYR